MVGYRIKYKCEFTSVKGLEYKVYILQKGYGSAVYDLRMGGNPIQINYTSGSENKFEIIRGSECVLNFFSEYDGQFSEIMYADKNDFLVQVHLNDELHWQGYVIQDNYNEPFASAPYPMSLRATDGLGDLKLIDFAKDNGTVFLNNMTFVEVILNCLAHLKNGNQLVTSNDVFEARIDRNVATNEAFNQLTVNPFIFLKNELNAKKCNEVLKMILELFQCYIYYKNGKYHVERINYKLNESLTRRTYNINFDGDQSILPIVTTEIIRAKIERGGSLSFINNDQHSTFAAAYNKVTVNSNTVDPQNLVVNNYFRFWDDNTVLPFSWNKQGTLSILKRNYIRTGDALHILSKVADNAISYSTNMLTPVKTSFQGALAQTGTDNLNIKVAHVGNIRFMVKAITPNMSYYLTCSGYTENQEQKYRGYYTTTANHCKFNDDGGDRGSNDQWYVNILDIPIPAGTIDINIGIMPSFVSANGRNNDCVIREFTPTIKAGNAARSNGDQYHITSSKNVRESYDDFQPALGEFDNIGLSNQICLNTSTGRTSTNSWYRDGKAETKALLQIGVQSILNQYRTSSRLFSGTFFGQFDYGKIYEIETLTGLFMPFKATTDLKFDTHNVEFFELLDDADVASDKYLRFQNYKDGEYTVRNQITAGGEGVPRPQRGRSNFI